MESSMKKNLDELLDSKPGNYNTDVYDVTTSTFANFTKFFKKNSTMMNAIIDEIAERYPVTFEDGKDLGRQENYEYFYDAIQAALRKVLNVDCNVEKSKKFYDNDYNV